MSKRQRTENGNGAARKRKNPVAAAAAPFHAGGYRGPEVKCLSLQASYDTTSGGGSLVPGVPLKINFTSTGNLLSIPLNCPQRGSGVSQRIGNKIRMSSLHMKFTIRPFIVTQDVPIASPGPLVTPSAAPDNQLGTDRLRMILFYDRQPNGGSIVTSDLLQDTGTDPSQLVSNIYSGMKMQNSERFLILRDEWFDAVATTGTPGVTINQTTSFWSSGTKMDGNGYNTFVKLKGLETHFYGLNANSGNSYAEISTGALGLLFLSERYNQFIAVGSTRLKYTDA